MKPVSAYLLTLISAQVFSQSGLASQNPGDKSTESTFAEACFQQFTTSVSQESVKKLEKKMRAQCKCQARAVLSAELDARDIKAYEKYLSGEQTQVAKSKGITKVARVYNRSEADCENAK